MAVEEPMTGRAGNPRVGILMGSESDLSVMESAFRILDDFEVPYEVRILSAHRSPDETARYADSAGQRGVQVLIAGAGWAAHLAGVVASRTTLPVIGVPIDSSPLQGMDALLATVQMPPGIPVATMCIGRGGALNAALFALQILALNDRTLDGKLKAYRVRMTEEVLGDRNSKLTEYLANRKQEGTA